MGHPSKTGAEYKNYGLVIGIVTNNQDPEKLGRVKVMFPWLSDTVESWWARLAYPMGGKERGFWWIPEVDDEVLVGFLQGDPNQPYVIGSLYNGVDTPPKSNEVTSTYGGTGYDHGGHDVVDFNEDGKNDIRFIQSRSGHIIMFDDSDGKERIDVVDHTGKHRIEVHSADKRVVITSEDGDIELIADKTILMRCTDLITHSRNNTEMTVDNDMTIEVGNNQDITVKNNITREATMNITETAKQNATYESKMSTKIKAGMNLDVEAGIAYTIKAPAGTVKADGTLTIKGGLVLIN